MSTKGSDYARMMTCNFVPNSTDDCIFFLLKFLCGRQPLQLLKKNSPTEDDNSQHNSLYIAKDGIQQFEELYLSQQQMILLGDNFAAFLQSSFNHPMLVREFGRPICVVNTGHHDVMIQNITLEQHFKNVRWYMELLLPQCQLIIWIETTSPKTNDYVQKKNTTRAWNEAVYNLLSSLDANLSSMEWEVYHATTTENKKHHTNNIGSIGNSNSDNKNTRNHIIGNGNRIFYMKTFDSSVDFEYRDNIHLKSPWYRSMSDTIMLALQSCPGRRDG